MTNLKILFIILGILCLPLMLTIWFDWEIVKNYESLVAFNSENVRPVMTHPLWHLVITFVVSTIGLWHVFNYFASFDPNNAVMNLIVPAAILYLAGNWSGVLMWIEIA